jgi:hypothetical protein
MIHVTTSLSEAFPVSKKQIRAAAPCRPKPGLRAGPRKKRFEGPYVVKTVDANHNIW